MDKSEPLPRILPRRFPVQSVTGGDSRRFFHGFAVPLYVVHRQTGFMGNSKRKGPAPVWLRVPSLLRPDCSWVEDRVRAFAWLVRCYRLLATLLKVFERSLPNVDMAVIAAMAIKAAIRPYSIAVAPDSSRRNFENMMKYRAAVVADTEQYSYMLLTNRKNDSTKLI